MARTMLVQAALLAWVLSVWLGMLRHAWFPALRVATNDLVRLAVPWAQFGHVMYDRCLSHDAIPRAWRDALGHEESGPRGPWQPLRSLFDSALSLGYSESAGLVRVWNINALRQRCKLTSFELKLPNGTIMGCEAVSPRLGL